MGTVLPRVSFTYTPEPSPCVNSWQYTRVFHSTANLYSCSV